MPRPMTAPAPKSSKAPPSLPSFFTTTMRPNTSSPVGWSSSAVKGEAASVAMKEVIAPSTQLLAAAIARLRTLTAVYFPEMGPIEINLTRLLKGFFHQVIFRSRAKRFPAIRPPLPHAPRAGRPRRMRPKPQDLRSSFCATSIRRNHHGNVMFGRVTRTKVTRLESSY